MKNNNGTVLNERLIKARMKSFADECTDRNTYEVNCTQLAEMVADDLDLYDGYDYKIPERVFEIAAELYPGS
jgi:hypothetical protein